MHPHRLRWFVPFLPFLVFLLCGLILLTASRILLLLTFRERVGDLHELGTLFLMGWRFDIVTLSYLLIPAWLLACLAPTRWERFTKAGLTGYFVTSLALIGLLECATWPSLSEFGSRPEALFLEFLGHPQEVLGMIFRGFGGAVLSGFGVVCLVGWGTSHALRGALSRPRPGWPPRLIALPLGSALLLLRARSSLQHRPANLSTAAFSQNHFHNEAALTGSHLRQDRSAPMGSCLDF